MASKPKLVADTKFAIIKNAPPEARVHRSYPFGGMDVGDAFDVPADIAPGVRSAAWHFGKYHGKTFSVRKIDVNTCRVFRTA